MPVNRVLIDSKCVFKKEIDGQFNEYIVAWRYTKITGVYFTINYSPVVTDGTPHCWESTYFMLHIVQSLISSHFYILFYIIYIRELFELQHDYFGVTIWHPFTIWHIFNIVNNILTCLLAKTWGLLTIILQSISSIKHLLKSVISYTS